MGNATLLNVIAASHAMSHAGKKEAWFCSCLACRFTKEYKFPVKEKDGTIREGTVAETLLESMEKQGYHTRIP